MTTDAIPCNSSESLYRLSDQDIWDNDALMAINAKAGLPFEVLREMVRAIESDVLNRFNKGFHLEQFSQTPVVDLLRVAFMQGKAEAFNDLSKERSKQMLSAITVLLNIAAFGSTASYPDGTPTPNSLQQIEVAKFLHSLYSPAMFEQEHAWLLEQVARKSGGASEPAATEAS